MVPWRAGHDVGLPRTMGTLEVSWRSQQGLLEEGSVFLLRLEGECKGWRLPWLP